MGLGVLFHSYIFMYQFIDSLDQMYIFRKDQRVDKWIQLIVIISKYWII